MLITYRANRKNTPQTTKIGFYRAEKRHPIPRGFFFRPARFFGFFKKDHVPKKTGKTPHEEKRQKATPKPPRDTVKAPIARRLLIARQAVAFPPALSGGRGGLAVQFPCSNFLAPFPLGFYPRWVPLSAMCVWRALSGPSCR